MVARKQKEDRERGKGQDILQGIPLVTYFLQSDPPPKSSLSLNNDIKLSLYYHQIISALIHWGSQSPNDLITSIKPHQLTTRPLAHEPVEEISDSNHNSM
jgi:hypothetical protein